MKSLAHALKMKHRRIQFALDLLPADAAGSEAHHQVTESKDFPLLAAPEAGVGKRPDPGCPG
ncbi:AAA family ATPase (plasmid) [Roseomonas gilardii subsp. gilardii]|uniref:AAA family ATPase n=1 Tax=Roseomonas gilardii TaxID=257708 RepID=UPI001FF87DA0|nr:AAA family ATPase [Roseomonas gilardii]UPG74699.1 AAA family ATPase [Roseomonas gilardii subsp. gilardii]